MSHPASPAAGPRSGAPSSGARSAGTQSAGTQSSRPGLLIGVLVASAFVMILNETILSVALRDLSGELDVSTSTVQWLTSGFLLTMAVVIPTTGFLLERFTPRQIFLASLTLFSTGTLIGALSPNFAVLLVARVVQASGTAVMLPMLMTTVMRLIPAARRGSAMGTITIVIAVAPAIGPTIGGAILEYLGWRWMFWIVLPLALIALAVGAARLHLPTTTRRVPVDVPSVLFSAIGFAGLLYGLSSFGEAGGGAQSVPPWVPVVVGVVSLTVFVARQLRLQRSDRALLDLRPFTRRPYAVAIVLSVPLFMSLIGAAAVLLPLYLQTVLGASTFVSGLAVLPGGLVLGLLGRPVGALFDRFGPRPLVIPGAAATAASLWLFTTLGPGSPLAAVIGMHVLLMAGLGSMMTPLMTSSLSSLPDHLYSHGSAILSTLQQVSGALGTAVFVTVAAVGAANPAGTPDASGLHASFVVAGCLGLVALGAALFVRGRPGREQAAPEATGTPAAPADTAPSPADTAPSPADTAPSPRDAVPTPSAGPVVVGVIATGDETPAVVTLVDNDGHQGGRVDASDGRYRLVVPNPGSWNLVVSAPGHRPEARRLAADDDGAALVEDFRLARAEARPVS